MALSILIDLIAAVAGLAAAYHWYLAASMKHPSFEIIGSYVAADAVIPPLDQWTLENAKKNRLAAIWTSASVGTAAVSSIVEAFTAH